MLVVVNFLHLDSSTSECSLKTRTDDSVIEGTVIKGQSCDISFLSGFFFFICVITAFKNFNYGLDSCCSQCCITETFLFSVGFAGDVLRSGLNDGGK